MKGRMSRKNFEKKESHHGEHGEHGEEREIGTENSRTIETARLRRSTLSGNPEQTLSALLRALRLSAIAPGPRAASAGGKSSFFITTFMITL